MKSQSASACEVSSSSSSLIREQARTLVHGVRAEGKVGKNRAPRPQRDAAVTEEMQTYFSKLKDLVPFMPKNKKVSKLEIIQHVIDYICDLQLTLESHPAARSAASSPATSSSGSSSGGSNSSSPSRQPLGVIATPNAIPNTCGAQEVSHLDKTSPHLDDMSSRPVSC